MIDLAINFEDSGNLDIEKFQVSIEFLECPNAMSYLL